MIKWNFNRLKEFIREFNPIEQRYLKYTGQKEEVLKYLEKCQKAGIERRWKLDEIEDTYQTIKKVYGEKNDEFCEIIEGASEKFLDQYVDIEGICQMFKSSYFYFEWMMHLEYNKEKHDYTNYRDHYVHQVRNMYEMFTFLDEMGFDKRCLEVYQSLDNEVGKLIRKSIIEEIYNMPGEEREIWDKAQVSEEKLKGILYSYLFHASAIVASLLHDIGYPVAYVGRTVRELGNFLPFTNQFIEEMEAGTTIHSALQDSLLYQVVGQKEVASQIAERDHGALSAVILLYKYYNNGKIAGLAPVKRAVIELSALMIYNHTMKFKDMGSTKSHHHRNVFCENPMSYLFRLCDDLQEWSRSYFEISRQSNFFVCGDCFMPLTRNAMVEGQKLKGEIKYSCWCGDNKGINTTTFAYRRLYNVEACKEIQLEISKEAKTGRESLTIHVQYEKSKMLQLAAYSLGFALKRAEGMQEIKKMLRGQSNFPDTFVDFFVSNNPIMLKAEIVADWFEKYYPDNFFIKESNEFKHLLDGRDFEEQWKLLNPIMEQMTEEEFLKGYKGDQQKMKEGLIEKQPAWGEKGNSIAYVWEKNRFYYYLALWGRIIQSIQKREIAEHNDSLVKIVLKLRKLVCEHFCIEGRSEKDLVEAYLAQKLRQYDRNQYKDIKNEKEWKLYFNSFMISSSEGNTVKGYVCNWKYEEIKKSAWNAKSDLKDIPMIYDYYSDYYLYYSIAHEQESEKVE